MSEVSQKPQCPVCLEVIDGEKNIVVTNCGHIFHATCIFMNMRVSSSCPICRTELIPDISERENNDGGDEYILHHGDIIVNDGGDEYILREGEVIEDDFEYNFDDDSADGSADGSAELNDNENENIINNIDNTITHLIASLDISNTNLDISNTNLQELELNAYATVYGN